MTQGAQKFPARRSGYPGPAVELRTLVRPAVGFPPKCKISKSRCRHKEGRKGGVRVEGWGGRKRLRGRALSYSSFTSPWIGFVTALGPSPFSLLPSHFWLRAFTMPRLYDTFHRSPPLASLFFPVAQHSLFNLARACQRSSRPWGMAMERSCVQASHTQRKRGTRDAEQ